MAILDIVKEIELDDRKIELFIPLGGLHQVGHVIVKPREKLTDAYTMHNEDEYLYLIRGELTVKTSDGLWKVKAGQFNKLPKGCSHIVENLSDVDCEFVFFNFGGGA